MYTVGVILKQRDWARRVRDRRGARPHLSACPRPPASSSFSSEPRPTSGCPLFSLRPGSTSPRQCGLRKSLCETWFSRLANVECNPRSVVRIKRGVSQALAGTLWVVQKPQCQLDGSERQCVPVALGLAHRTVSGRTHARAAGGIQPAHSRTWTSSSPGWDSRFMSQPESPK